MLLTHEAAVHTCRHALNLLCKNTWKLLRVFTGMPGGQGHGCTSTRRNDIWRYIVASTGM